MSGGPMQEPTLERWFAERAARLEQPRSGFEEMLAQAAVTPQQRFGWLPAGVGSGQLRVSLAAVAALSAVIVALVSLGVLTSSTPVEVVSAPAAEESLAPAVSEPAPVPETDSMAATTFETVTAAGLRTEPVVAGIDEILRDGANHALRETNGFAIGPDGRAWASRDDRMIQIGAPGAYTRDEGAPKGARNVWTGADGQPFTRALAGVFTLDTQRWVGLGSMQADAPAGLDIGWDHLGPGDFGWQPATTATSGEVWGVAPAGIVQRDGDRWVLHTPATMGIDWPGGLDPGASRAVRVVGGADGSVWAELRLPGPQDEVAWPGSAPHERSMLVRHDGDTWANATPPSWFEAGDDDLGAVPIVTSLLPTADGSLWVPFVYRQGLGSDAHLARWDGRSWTTTVAPSRAVSFAADDHLAWYLVVVDDGRSLVLYRFDGVDWASRTIEVGRNRLYDWRLRAAPDGTLWLHASGLEEDSRLYVIDPDELGFDGGA